MFPLASENNCIFQFMQVEVDGGGAIDGAKYSVEFCGGTHIRNTADAAAFVLLGEYFYLLWILKIDLIAS